MTPRSRKPVIVGSAMLGIAGDNYHKSIMNYVKDDCDYAEIENVELNQMLNASLQKSKSESDLLPAIAYATVADDQFVATKSTSDETLSTPFR